MSLFTTMNAEKDFPVDERAVAEACEPGKEALAWGRHACRLNGFGDTETAVPRDTQCDGNGTNM